MTSPTPSSASSAASAPGVGGSIRNRVTIMPGALVCEVAELRGDITIGSRTVVHPKARIIAEAGPIIIGEGNLIEEQSEIINRFPGKYSISNGNSYYCNNHR